jgi:hypothetical protein
VISTLSLMLGLPMLMGILLLMVLLLETRSGLAVYSSWLLMSSKSQ